MISTAAEQLGSSATSEFHLLTEHSAPPGGLCAGSAAEAAERQPVRHARQVARPLTVAVFESNSRSPDNDCAVVPSTECTAGGFHSCTMCWHAPVGSCAASSTGLARCQQGPTNAGRWFGPAGSVGDTRVSVPHRTTVVQQPARIEFPTLQR